MQQSWQKPPTGQDFASMTNDFHWPNFIHPIKESDLYLVIQRNSKPNFIFLKHLHFCDSIKIVLLYHHLVWLISLIFQLICCWTLVKYLLPAVICVFTLLYLFHFLLNHSTEKTESLTRNHRKTFPGVFSFSFFLKSHLLFAHTQWNMNNSNVNGNIKLNLLLFCSPQNKDKC